MAKTLQVELRAPGVADPAEIERHLRAEAPDAVISTHPERWTASALGWLQVLATDTAISIAKRMLRPWRSGALGRRLRRR